MRMRSSLALVVLAGAGLAMVHGFISSRPPPAVPEAPPSAPEYFAEYGGACGLTLLKLARTESGPFEHVYAEGTQVPDQLLRPHAWRAGRFIVRGRLTGAQRGDSQCGSWPEFEVLGFRPWGPIRRCTSLGSADSSMLLYTGSLPKDRYAPEDFIDGPLLPLVDEESCRPTESCEDGERRIEDCTGETWCCQLKPLGPENPRPAPSGSGPG
jgi:hypothetical protein